MTGSLPLVVEDRVAVLTLAFPPVNAIGTAMLAELERVLDRLEATDDVAVLCIRSAQRIFSAGADLKQIGAWAANAAGPAMLTAWLERLNDALDRLAALPCLTIAELSGSALGGGLEMALACDLRIAAEGGQFGLPEVKVGLVPGAGGTQRLTTLCGVGAAKRLILTGETVGAAEALSLGLVQWVYPADRFRSATDELLALVARVPVAAIQAAKRCVAIAAPLDPVGRRAEIESVTALLGVPACRSALGQFLGRNAR